MRISVLGAALIWGAMMGSASAEPGQCSATGFETFDCELARDGGGLTFALPDGQVFAFALVSENEGLGYLGAPDALYPAELGTMTPAPDAPGCWVGGKDGFAFCAQVAQ
tara:strand:+ start:373 stop:699 length:327 start_codon:yes stop_codon:yes gene_type:complete